MFDLQRESAARGLEFVSLPELGHASGARKARMEFVQQEASGEVCSRGAKELRATNAPKAALRSFTFSVVAAGEYSVLSGNKMFCA